MTGEVVLHCRGRPPERLAVGAALSAGGSEKDSVRLAGAPEAALILEPSPAGVVVAARAGGLRAGGRPLPPGERRLLRPGERIEVLGHAIEAPAAPTSEGTRAMAGALLREAVAGRRPIAGPHLVVVDGAQAGARFPLRASQILGRARGASVRLRDGQVSRAHARIALREGNAAVEDLGSKNGVRVNGAPLGRGPRALRPGDEILVGATLLVVTDPFAAAPDPAAAVSETSGADPAPRLSAASILSALGALLALGAAALALASV